MPYERSIDTTAWVHELAWKQSTKYGLRTKMKLLLQAIDQMILSAALRNTCNSSAAVATQNMQMLRGLWIWPPEIISSV